MSETMTTPLVTVKTKGLLFDMDGVLVDSTASVRRVWRQWAAMYGVPDAENYEMPHGTRAIEIIRGLRPDIDAAEGLRVVEQMEIDDTDGLVALPGVQALLKALPKERWTIVTSATGRLMLSRLKTVGLPVPKELISGDMVEQGKPHPEPYLRGAALLGFAPEDCIVIEDAPSGVGAGKAAGCRVLGVLGTHAAEELQAADWLVESLEGVKLTVTADGLELRFGTV